MSAGNPKPTANYLAHRAIVITIAAVLAACCAIGVIVLVPASVSWIQGVTATLHGAWHTMGWSLW